MTAKQEMLLGFNSDTEDFRTKLMQHGVIGKSEKLEAAFQRALDYAYSDSPVLITAETGTGKDICARFIHVEGPRNGGPFIAVNCSAIPHDLFESQFYGHARGAFTGANNSHAGFFERANGGTLFLDEINSLFLAGQPKLLRAIQEGECHPLGSERILRFNVRIICASNCDLEAEVKAGRFRQDLFYRINILQQTLPPLRERKEDIPLLAASHLKFLLSQMEKASPRHWPWSSSSRRAKDFTEGALAKMMEYNWPGNVRELKNRVERAWVLCRQKEIREKDLDFETPSAVLAEESFQAQQKRMLGAFQRNRIQEALRAANGNKTQAAKLAGMHPRSFFRLISKHNRESVHIQSPVDALASNEAAS